MIKKIKQSIILAFIFALAMPAISQAEFPPSPPTIVSGTVTIDGNLATDGTVSIEDVTDIIGSDGKYTINIPSEYVSSEDKVKILTFKVNDQISTSQTITEPIQIVDLSINTTQTDEPELSPASPSENTSNSEGTPSSGSGGSGGTPSAPPIPPTEDTDEQVPPKIPEVKGVTTTNILDGDIIQCKSCSNPFAVYIVKQVGEKQYIRHIVSLEIFNYYSHLKWENLQQVDSLDDYSMSGWVRVNTGLNGTPGPNDRVYEINGDQTRHWINMTAEQFLTHGGSDDAIYSVNQGELDLYTAGADVMSL